jgi:hypothetical protein
MKVERTEDGHVLIEIDVDDGRKLVNAIREHADEITSGCLELASLLSEANYNAKNDFRQPPHAFDEHAPRAPSVED